MRLPKSLLVFLRVLLWSAGLVLTITVIIGIGLQIPAVQQFGARKVTAYLSSRLKAPVSIGRLTTDWQNSVVLKEIYLQDKNRDTLLYAGRLGLDLNILALKSGRIKIRTAQIQNGVLKISRSEKDSTFNFGFIKEAFKASPDPSGQPVALTLKNLKIQNVNLQLQDPVNGNFIRTRIGTFIANLEEFDTGKSVYQLGNLKLKNTFIRYKKTKPSPPSSPDSATDLSFKNVNLENLQLLSEDQVKQQRVSLKIGWVKMKAEKIMPAAKRADLKKIEVRDAVVSVLKLKSNTGEQAAAVPAESLPAQAPWAIWLHETEIVNGKFKYRDLNFPAKKGLDLKNLQLSGVGLKLLNLSFSQRRLSVELKQFAFKEKCGLKLVSGKGIIKAGAEGISVKNLELETPNSKLKAAATVGFSRQKPETALPEKPVIDLVITSAKIALRELLFIAPELSRNPFFSKLANQPVLISGQASDNGKGWNLRNFRITGLTGTKLNFTGQLPEAENKRDKETKLLIHQLKTNRNDLNILLTKQGQAPKIKLPAQLTLKGTFFLKKNSLQFRDLQGSTSNGTQVKTSGSLTGTENKYVELNNLSLQTNRAALLEMLPPGTITPEVQLPEKIAYSGKFKGYSLASFNLNGGFKTSFGNINTNLQVRPVQQFSGDIALENFDLGKLLNQENTLGPVTGQADFRGKGFKVKTMELHYDARVKKFVYKKETYWNIRLEGNLNQKIYKQHGNLKSAILQGVGHKLKKVKPKNIDLKKADPTRLIPKKIEPKKIIPKRFRKKEKSPTAEETK